MGRNLVISGASAMQAWDEGAASYARPSRIKSPSTFASTASELVEFTTLPQGCTQPVEILVDGGANRPRTRRWRAHMRKEPMPSGSLLELGGGRLLVSPSCFFLHTAPHLTFVQAVLLGMELCGFYSTLMSAPYREHCARIRQQQGGALLSNPWPPQDWGMSVEHQRNLMDNGFVNREPLVTVSALSKFLERTLSDRSTSRALRAARYIVDKSRSPMESRLYARYCLPRSYGGLALTPVELNREFELSEDIVRATGITKYTVDLFWPTGAVAVEYQGAFAHSGLSAEQKDRLKRNILDTVGVRIISVDSSQYKNQDVLDLYAHEIAQRMGIKKWRRKPAPSELRKRAALVHELEAWDIDLYRPKSQR